MINFEPFVGTDAFTMQNFNEKLGGVVNQTNSEIQDVKDSGLKIETGSYVGTGGLQGSVSITFGFTPKIWGIIGIDDSDNTLGSMPWVYGITKVYSASGSSAYGWGTVYENNTVTWSYSINLETYMYLTYNNANVTYHYFAIG